jgi:hypothetical protein
MKDALISNNNLMALMEQKRLPMSVRLQNPYQCLFEASMAFDFVPVFFRQNTELFV